MGRRKDRLNEQMKREITEILRRDVRDPRVAGVTVTAVDVTSDLWLARVYLQILGDPEERAEALEGLAAAAPFVRRQLGVLRLRRIPEVRFMEDETLASAQRIEDLLREVDLPDDPEDVEDPEEEGE